VDALIKRERLDRDDFFVVAQTVVAVDEIGEMAGEIGDECRGQIQRDARNHRRTTPWPRTAIPVRNSSRAIASRGPYYLRRPYDAEKLVELPFVMGVMADLSGNNSTVEKPT
jgi:hypothetical protein